MALINFQKKNNYLDISKFNIVEYEPISSSGNMPDLAFITCIEPGFLVEQSLFLYESIRKFTGRFSKCPIYAFSPRKGLDIGRDTKKALEKLDVIHINEKININEWYGWGNKPYVCAYAEENLNHKYLVHLDSDLFFLREPNELELSEDYDVAVRPVDFKWNFFTSGIEDKYDECWHYMCKCCNVEYRKMPLINTAISNVRIKACFNAGLISIRRGSGIFIKWLEDFSKMMKEGYDPRISELWVDCQTTLSTGIYGKTDKVCIFSNNYNYHPIKIKKIQRPVTYKSSSDLVCIHYHNKLSREFIHQNPIFDTDFVWEDEILYWMKDKIPFRISKNNSII